MDQFASPQGANGGGMQWLGVDPGRQPNAYFYTRSVINKAKTAQEGRPIHDGVVFVMIRHPGERDCTDRPATEQDKARFPQQWAAFAQNMSQVPEGTPLEILFPLNPEIASNLRSQGVHTVEQLAALSGDALRRVGMGSQGMQVKAQQFLAQASKGVEFHQMQAALKGRDDRIAALEESLKMAQAQLSRLIAQTEGMRQGVQQMPALSTTQIAAAEPAYLMSPAAPVSDVGEVDFTEQPKRPVGRARKSTGL
jgi:hypothetical protein